MPNKTLYLYRQDTDGRRTRWAFELDDRMTILSESPVEEQTTSIPGVRTAVVDGRRQVTQIDPQTQRAYQFFLPDNPCWFDGCDELREEYEQAVEARGSDCPACKKGELIRKYLPRVLELMGDQ